MASTMNIAMPEGLEVTFGAYQESWQTGDIDKFLSYYAEDVKFFCNDIPGVLVGREKIRDRFKREMERVDIVDVEVVDRVMEGNIVSDVGIFHTKVKGEDKKEATRFMATYVKKDGKWVMKMNVHMFTA